MCCVWSIDESPCFYQSGKGSSDTDTFVRSTNVYLPKRLTIIAAGLSDQCALGSGHDATTGIHWVKSELAPAQIFTYLGVVFNLVEASARPTDGRILRFLTP